MKLYIPDIGDTLRLTEDWSFKLCNESRNSGVWDAFKKKHPDMDLYISDIRDKIEAEKKAEEAQIRKDNPGAIAIWYYHLSRDYWAESRSAGYPITLLKDTVLRVDRIYIRKGASDYSSVTFNVMQSPEKFLTLAKDGGTFPKGTRRRFWAKLQDVNAIEFDRI